MIHCTELSYTIKPTSKKCLECKKVYAVYLDNYLQGYFYKVPKQTIKRIHRILPKMGIPEYNRATLLNGWYYSELKQKYHFFKDGSITATKKQIVDLPEGFLLA